MYTIEKVYGHPNQTYNFQLPCRMYGILENNFMQKNDNLILMTLYIQNTYTYYTENHRILMKSFEVCRHFYGGERKKKEGGNRTASANATLKNSHFQLSFFFFFFSFWNET